MGKKVAILQSSYIPWKGYFDIINLVDEFILYDDVQFTKRDWRSRNAIKTSQGAKWLTIPVNVKGKYQQPINEVTVTAEDWTKNHWLSIVHNYSKAKHFAEFAKSIETAYQHCAQEKYLSQINFYFIKLICDILQIKTKITWSTDYAGQGNKTERLVSLCQAAGANYYLSGPAAKEYIKPGLFAAENIELTYMDYSGYPVYPQLFGEFNHFVTILDLLLNVGLDAKHYMKSFK